MPRFDGTGPLGQGPMTGRGRGFCVLQVPQEPGAPLTSIAGQAGRPIGGTSVSWTELARLRSEARRIEAILIAIRSRIAALEACRTPTGSGE